MLSQRAFFLESSDKKSHEETKKKKFTLAFYNVENLYDTNDDSEIDDNDFLPEGKQKWTTDRYNKKIKNLASVISQLGDADGPEILGLCEIENLSVLEELAAQKELKNYEYQIAHFDSPDKRGIDVALFFKKDFLTDVKKEKFPVTTPQNKPSRDVLFVSGKIGKNDVYFIVNHFPSRREGESESEPNRLEAGKVTRSIIDKIFAQNSNANIFVMGDYNDEPYNKSITEAIRANGKPDFAKNELKNLFFDIAQTGRGSYNFKGEWNMLDQMMVSKAVMRNISGIKFVKADIYSPEFLKEKNRKYKGNPFRTFAGPNYLGGFSDHFPIYAIFE
jgi:predicted extracellular nuclease